MSAAEAVGCASAGCAAKSISKLHPQLAQGDVVLVTRFVGPDEGEGERQLTLV